MSNKIIQKVWQNKCNKQKLVTIPKDSNIDAGDYVAIRKLVLKKKNTNTIKKEVNENGTGDTTRDTSNRNSNNGFSNNGFPPSEY